MAGREVVEGVVGREFPNTLPQDFWERKIEHMREEMRERLAARDAEMKAVEDDCLRYAGYILERGLFADYTAWLKTQDQK